MLSSMSVLMSSYTVPYILSDEVRFIAASLNAEKKVFAENHSKYRDSMANVAHQLETAVIPPITSPKYGSIVSMCFVAFCCASSFKFFVSLN